MFPLHMNRCGCRFPEGFTNTVYRHNHDSFTSVAKVSDYSRTTGHVISNGGHHEEVTHFNWNKTTFLRLLTPHFVQSLIYLDVNVF